MNRKGFTIVEIMIAVVILCVGLLGLASAGATVTRMLARGSGTSLTSNFTQKTLDSLRSLDWCKSSPTKTGSNSLKVGGQTLATSTIHVTAYGTDGWIILDSVSYYTWKSNNRFTTRTYVAETGVSCRF
ncbi:MAG TPA: prepilin-type N-terminal cleavage/methylation domain-containing protein [Gemmatimonadales bacterium]|jgi:prepilin-type N-terminal cleavage/methylation domain-containing protein|nr:prepilin-type N-terminal cleavage/methylation domain-containing protein [Gemmatimonadales bacterium]